MRLTVLAVLTALTLSFGCRVEQEPVCAEYIACLYPAGGEEVDSEAPVEERDTVIRYFGEDGQCWREPDLTPECVEACTCAQTEFCERPGAAEVSEACADFCG